jgi:phosphohistidine phosphatase
MKTLILLRHAKSSWNSDAGNDHDRPLAGRGRRDAPEMGRRLRQRGIAVDRVLVSSAKRAQETARLVAAELDIAALDVNPELYLASAGDMLARVQQQASSVKSSMLVAHNPGITDLANILCPAVSLPNLATAGVVVLEYAIDDWQTLSAQAGRLVLHDYPKNRADSPG